MTRATIRFEEAKYGSIYAMEREEWWDLGEDGDRLVPPTPDSLRFEIVSEVERSGSLLSLKGLLINGSLEEAEIPIFPYPGVFWMDFAPGPGITKKPFDPPRPPPAPPEPHVFFMKGGSIVEFEAVLDLSYYDYRPDTVAELEWTFSYWHEPRPRGKVRVGL